jgi:hypothetical protein
LTSPKRAQHIDRLVKRERIFNSTGGSLVMAVLYHASLNVAAGPLQFDPGDLVAPLLTWLVVVLLVLRYGARDLARQQRFTWEHRPAR